MPVNVQAVGGNRPSASVQHLCRGNRPTLCVVTVALGLILVAYSGSPAGVGGVEDGRMYEPPPRSRPPAPDVVDSTGGSASSADLTVNAAPKRPAVATASPPYEEPEAAAERALTMCREMTQGKQCALLRDAVVTDKGTILVPRRANADFAQRYPEGSGVFPKSQTKYESRYHRRAVAVSIVDDDDPGLASAAAGPTTVAFYQLPVIGAMYQNVWHTLSDMYLIMHHTVQPLVDAGAHLTWITESPRLALQTAKACATLHECRKLSLFAAFDNLFDRRVFFASEGFGVQNDSKEDGAPPTTPVRRLRFNRILLGLNTRCSPAPMEGLDAPECHAAIEGMRRSLLKGVGLPDASAVTATQAKCPAAHVMSRQRDKYRRITPFEDMVDALRASYSERGCDPALVRVHSLHGGMSLAAQIASIANATILVAGRGGGTGYSPLLPRGGGYLSLSGSDEWSPYRGLVPKWITMQHHRVRMVSHIDPSKPPQRFYKPPIIDANRVGYAVEPAKVVEAFWKLAAALPPHSGRS